MEMYAIIRLRGSVNTSPNIQHTLELLRLHKVNHCVLVDENAYYKGMIQKAKDYIAWGEISESSVELLLKYRGRLEGGKRLTDDYIRVKTSFSALSDFAHNLYGGLITQQDLKALKIKPVFRLHPPRKGHRGIKRTVRQGGMLGYHGATINDLLLKMR